MYTVLCANFSGLQSAAFHRQLLFFSLPLQGLVGELLSPTAVGMLVFRFLEICVSSTTVLDRWECWNVLFRAGNLCPVLFCSGPQNLFCSGPIDTPCWGTLPRGRGL